MIFVDVVVAVEIVEKTYLKGREQREDFIATLCKDYSNELRVECLENIF